MDPIAAWHALLRPEAERTPRFCLELAASMRDRKLTFGNRIHCPFLRPFFLTEKDETRMRVAAETVAAFGERVTRAALESRDVFDQLVRMSDEAMFFQDRVAGILDAHLAATSNKLALASQRLAAVATIFGTLTVLTGLYGMNVRLPGVVESSPWPFWGIVGFGALLTAALATFFRRRRWL